MRAIVAGVIAIALGCAPSPGQGEARCAPEDGVCFDRRGARAEIAGRTVDVRLAAVERERPIALRDADPETSGAYVRYQRAPGVTEWWARLASGLEHGVTIAERPAGTGALRVAIAFAGELSPRGEGEVALVDARGAVVGRYDGLAVLDARGDRVPARMRAEHDRVWIEVDDREARYPLIVDPFVGEAEVRLQGTSIYEGFGAALAMDATGTRVIVGQPDRTYAAAPRGRAFVYVRSGSSWSEEAVLHPAVQSGNELVGAAVAIDAEGTRVLVAAPGELMGTSLGVVRVYARSGTTWALEATLAVPGALALGRAVALSADGSVALIGAPSSDRAYVLTRAGTTWTLAGTLEPSGSPPGQFGAAVALSGDGTRAFVGAPYETFVEENAGALYVFAGTSGGTAWSEEVVLRSDAPRRLERYGIAVAASADATRLLVGAPGSNSAHVFTRSGTTWSPEVTWTGVTTFGTAVALRADGAQAAIGAPAGTTRGRVDDYVRTGTTWSQRPQLVGPTSSLPTQFGGAIALTNDGGRIAIGAQGYASTRGAVHVYTDVGAACASDGECASGACVDGVCCDSACGGGAVDCQACAGAATGGVDGRCAPLSAAIAPTVTCRPPAGPCDRAEVCRASDVACPSDGRLIGVPCRPAQGGCDAAEICTGLSNECPADVLRAPGFVCRMSGGACDPEETCDGTSVECPADEVLPAGTECRAAIGECDAAETCNGVGRACPADAYAPSATVCREAADACDVAETCDGASLSCPPDVRACDDAGMPELDAGMVELDAGAIDLDAGVELDAGAFEVDAGVIELDAGAIDDDAGEPEDDAGPEVSDDASLELDAGAADASTSRTDAGVAPGADAGTAAGEAGGCSCRVAPHRAAPTSLAWLVLAAAALLRRASHQRALRRRASRRGAC